MSVFGPVINYFKLNSPHIQLPMPTHHFLNSYHNICRCRPQMFDRTCCKDNLLTVETELGFSHRNILSVPRQLLLELPELRKVYAPSDLEISLKVRGPQGVCVTCISVFVCLIFLPN